MVTIRTSPTAFLGGQGMDCRKVPVHSRDKEGVSLVKEVFHLGVENHNGQRTWYLSIPPKGNSKSNRLSTCQTTCPPVT